MTQPRVGVTIIDGLQVPIIIHRRDLERIAPLWLEKTKEIRKDKKNWPKCVPLFNHCGSESETERNYCKAAAGTTEHAALLVLAGLQKCLVMYLLRPNWGSGMKFGICRSEPATHLNREHCWIQLKL